MQVRQELTALFHLGNRLAFFAERAGGADMHAFAAAGAGFGGAPGLIEVGDHACAYPAAHEVPGMRAFDFAADADASAAEHAAVVVSNKSLMGGVDRKLRRAVWIFDMSDAEGQGEVLEFAMPVRHAYRTDVVAFGEEKLDDLLAEAHNALGIGDYLHAFLAIGYAGGQQLRDPFYLDDAEAAGAALGQAFEVAESGYIDAFLLGDLEDGFILSARDIYVIYLESQDAGRVKVGAHFSRMCRCHFYFYLPVTGL